MPERPLGARRRQRRAAVWIAATVVGSGAVAQSTTEAPDFVGFKAGGVMIAPSLTAGYAYDTNVLQQSDDVEPPPEPDQVLTLQPALLLTVPFSNSLFQFGDVLTYVDYKNTSQSSGKTSNDALAELTLNFGSRDQLEMSAHNITGAAQTIVFDPGVQVPGFTGVSFKLHNEAVAFSRVTQGARGYRLALERNALRFDPTNAANFYNYRGFDGEVAYFEPLSPNTLLSFGYLGARYDQFDATNPSSLLRVEDGDTAYCQIQGQLGPRQPYSVRLGWQRLTFEGAAVTTIDDFSGIVGEVRLSTIVGGGTAVTFQVQRQPYRSYVESNNYYVFDLIGGYIERAFPQGSTVGGAVAVSQNGYNQPTADSETNTVYFRQDRRFQVEAYANLAIARSVIFRVSLARSRRYSNAPGADYKNMVLFGGFVFGWI